MTNSCSRLMINEMGMLSSDMTIADAIRVRGIQNAGLGALLGLKSIRDKVLIGIFLFFYFQKLRGVVAI